MGRISIDGRFARMRATLSASARVPQQWSPGRRSIAGAGVIALTVAVATSALLASPDHPTVKDVAATGQPAPPSYLLPLGAQGANGSVSKPAFTGDQGNVGVPAGTPKAPTKPNPVTLTRQGPAIAPYQGSPGTLTAVGIATLALAHGCSPDAGVVATAIAIAESGGSPSAQGDIALMTSVWDWSAGLWQIRGLRAERSTGQLRDSVANQAVGNNAAAMQTISQGCTNWSPWSTYTNGAYLQFTTVARQAVDYVVGYYNAHGRHYPTVPAPDPTATIPSQGTGVPAAAPVGVTGAARTRTTPAARPSHTPSRPATTTPRGGHATTTTPTAPARTPPAPSTSTRPAGVPIPLPTIGLPGTKAPRPLPLPTLSLPPLPTLTLPHFP